MDTAKASSLSDILVAWGVDVGCADVRLPPAFRSYVLLHGVSTEVDGMHPWAREAWSDPTRTRADAPTTSRLGDSCVAELLVQAYPPREAFLAARDIALLHRYPVVLIFGQESAWDAPRGRRRLRPLTAAESAGLQALVFAPGSGQTSRAHWRSSTGPDGPMHLCIGELGARFPHSAGI